jgi:hypothetical protein
VPLGVSSYPHPAFLPSLLGFLVLLVEGSRGKVTINGSRVTSGPPPPFAAVFTSTAVNLEHTLAPPP